MSTNPTTTEQAEVTAPDARPMPTTVTQAISRVMEDLPAIAKKLHPSGGDRGITYAYRGIEQITSETQGLFAKYGVTMSPKVKSHEVVAITLNGKPWSDTYLMVEYRLYGPSHGLRDLAGMGTGFAANDSIKVGPFLAIGRDNSDKGANKAMTQAYKQMLLQVLCISDKNDDADGTTHEADAIGAPPARRRQSGTRRRSAPPVANPDGDARRDAIVAAFAAVTDDAARSEAKSTFAEAYGNPMAVEPESLDVALALAVRLTEGAIGAEAPAESPEQPSGGSSADPATDPVADAAAFIAELKADAATEEEA